MESIIFGVLIHVGSYQMKKESLVQKKLKMNKQKNIQK
jgi:hypothetical protein